MSNDTFNGSLVIYTLFLAKRSWIQNNRLSWCFGVRLQFDSYINAIDTKNENVSPYIVGKPVALRVSIIRICIKDSLRRSLSAVGGTRDGKKRDGNGVERWMCRISRYTITARKANLSACEKRSDRT